MEKKFSLLPHPDLELGLERKPIDYFLTFPDSEINEDTGLILVIPGFNHRADTEYHQNKLRPYLVNKYNCIAVGINYFGIKIECREIDNNILNVYIPDNRRFANSVYDMFGIPADDILTNNIIHLDTLTRMLKARGIKKLGPEFAVELRYRSDADVYQSFGLLPAIDCIQVLGEILKTYAINKKRLIAFGSSYGGYISLLLGKFAPQTFSAIVDVSGFVKTRLALISPNDVRFEKRSYGNMNGIEFPVNYYSPWTITDEDSPYYFSDSHRCIRNLMMNEHITDTKTKYHIFHSVEDSFIPIKEKDKLVAMMTDRGVRVSYRRVGHSDIDGRLFKTLEHGMEASLRGVFDAVANQDDQNLSTPDSLTDFDRESIYKFNCGERIYTFSFGNDFSIKAECSAESSNLRSMQLSAPGGSKSHAGRHR